MRRSLSLVLVLLLLGCSEDGTPDSSAYERPNIIFIFSDDHASKAISAYGSDINQTPNIDRLADEGMLFENCFVTNSICAPSRATVLTGKYSHLNGQLVNGPRFDGSQQTFPKLLQNAGYQTAIVGKWHLKSAPTGFDHWQVLLGQGPYYNPPIRTPEDTTIVEGYTTDVITDLTLDWLKDSRDPEKPFMLMFQHKAPHRRWDPSPDHLSMYDDVEIAEPSTLFDDYTGRASAARTANMQIATNLTARDLKIEPPNNLTDSQLETWNAAYGPKNQLIKDNPLEGEEFIRWKYQRYIKDYLRAVASVDDNIGRVLEYLDESGLAENTIVIYNSDQGWYLGEHGWYDKRWMYEQSLKTPFIVRWPDVIEAGTRSNSFVSNLDFASTFLAVADAEIPSDLQGESLLPLFETKTEPEEWRNSFYYHYYEYPGAHCVQRHYGVRTERYKLIYYYSIDEWELFDLQEDPDELNSVYNLEENQSLISDLKAELQELREEYAVPEDARPTGPCSYDAEGWDGYSTEP